LRAIHFGRATQMSVRHDRFSTWSSHEVRGSHLSCAVAQINRERRIFMKNEFAKIQVISKLAGGLAVFWMVDGIFALMQGEDDLVWPIMVARLTVILAVSCLLTGRFVRRVAVVCPAPGGDLQPLLSKLSVVLGEFGYRAVDTAVGDRWAFVAVNPKTGEPLCRPSSCGGRVSVEVAGPALIRVVGSSALTREIRKQFPGTVAAPYTGPQPWIARPRGTLVLVAMVVLVFGACMTYIAPVLRTRQLPGRHNPPAVAGERGGQRSAVTPKASGH
jgi:hypothetical protein